MSEDTCVPIELKQAFPIDVAREKTRDLIRKVGALLCAWPDLVDAAKELSARSVRISKRIENIPQCLKERD
jgi:hypothetical protein